MRVDWQGVFPAKMTEMTADGALDLEATGRYVDACITAGCTGMVMLGTLGENCSLSPEEKAQVLECAVDAAAGRIPVLSGVAEYTPAFAIAHAKRAQAAGCAGLMVLPPMVYKTDPRESVAHFRTVAAATDLPIMVYNNPVTYGVDISPEMFADLGDVDTLVAIKESSDDPRRVTDLINVCGDRYVLFSGVDDIVAESVMFGCQGWVAGLVNAFPAEAVRLFELAKSGPSDELLALYRWFMPLLHLDCLPKLVQAIKLTNQMAGMGAEHVRPPRLPLEGAERAEVEAIVRRALETRPSLSRMAAE